MEQSTLQAPHNPYLRMIEMSPDGFIIYNDQGSITYANSAAIQMLDEQKRELNGIHISNFVEERERDIFLEKRCVNPSDPPFVTQMRRKDGQLFYAEVRQTFEKSYEAEGQVVCVFRDVTAQRLEQYLLEESKGQYQRMVDESPHAILIYTDDRVVYANQESVRIFGVKDQQDLIGRPILSLYPLQTHKHVLEQMNQIHQNPNESLFTEDQMITCQGEILDVELSATSILYQGNISGQLIIRDVSERNRQAREVVETKNRLQSLFDNAQDAVSVLDLEGKVLKVNPAWEDMYGWTEPEVLGRFNPISVERRIDVLRDWIERIKRNEKIAPYETRCRRKDGTELYVYATLYPIHDADGEVVSLTLSTRDITARKNAEQALQLSEERYRLITENTTDLICVLNQEGIVTYASPSYEWVLGVQPKDYVGDYGRSLVFTEDQEDVRMAFQKAVQTGEPVLADFRKRHADGNDFIYVESSFIPVFNGDGSLLNVTSVARNITERYLHRRKLESMAYEDSLTKLPNRRMFVNRLKEAVSQEKRQHTSFGVMFLDCDRFKQINDTYGHEIGDKILQGFAKRLQENVRTEDVVARLGGDEFTILLPNLDNSDEAIRIAERIIDAMKEPWSFQNGLRTSTSIGITLYQRGERPEDVMNRADDALYEAKESGRNNFKFRITG